MQKELEDQIVLNLDADSNGIIFTIYETGEVVFPNMKSAEVKFPSGATSD